MISLQIWTAPGRNYVGVSLALMQGFVLAVFAFGVPSLSLNQPIDVSVSPSLSLSLSSWLFVRSKLGAPS